MMKSQEHLRIDARNVKPLVMSKDDVAHFNLEGELRKIGVGLDAAFISQAAEFLGYAMDDLTTPLTDPSVTTPIQFLQNWLPGFVKIVTSARKIDNLVGLSTTGSWEDEEIVQGLLERTGSAVPYGDYTNVPFSSWNTNFERRTVVRFEEGMRVGSLEEARASRQRVNSAAEKREAAALSLEIIRNQIGFFGYNNGINRTYGFLNDPQLPAYVTVPVGGSGSTEWSTKTYLEIVSDILTALADLRIQSEDVIDVKSTPIVLALPTAAVDYLSTTSDFGYSVQKWMDENYRNIRVESAPELDAANGGDNVFYLYAESVDDSSSDDSRTWIQAVPSKFTALGVQQLAKGYEESYTNATAGLMLKRPYAVVRRSGI